MKHNIQTHQNSEPRVSSSSKSENSSRLILIVDNSPYTARVTAQLFKTLGYTTEIAHSPAGALTMLTNGEVFPDLIFLEMRYHHENVFEFPRKVHTNPLWSKLPIVARTAGTDKQGVLRAVKSGFSDVIVRPIETDILKEKIDKIFSSSTNIDSSTFALPVFSRASISSEIDITAISEFGVEGTSAIPLEPNTILKINSDFLNQFELSGTHFRVAGCERQNFNEMAPYKIALTFVGLTAKSATLIRQYLVRKASTNSKVA